jgi:hypothetical protein
MLPNRNNCPLLHGVTGCEETVVFCGENRQEPSIDASLDLTQFFYAVYYEGRPARLVARTDASPVVSVEVFVKQDQVPPFRVRGKNRESAVKGPPRAAG